MAEALAILPALELAATPATEAEVSAWLLPLGGAVANPPADRTEYEIRVQLIARASGDLPASVFTPEDDGGAAHVQILAYPADVDALLRPRAREILRTLAGARRVAASAPKAAEERRPVAADARDAVVSKFKREIATVSLASRPSRRRRALR